MKAIIPVAGIGTRLRPYTYSVPKVLLHVAGKPILDYSIDELIDAGIDEIIIIKGYLGDQIVNHVSAKYASGPCKFTFIEQKEQKGLGEAVLHAKSRIPSGNPVIIVLGDTIFKADYKALARGPESMLCVKPVSDPRKYGVALTENGYAKKLIEKPDPPVSNLALVGLYRIDDADLLFSCLEENIANNVRTKHEFQLTDGLDLMLRKGHRMRTLEIEDWYDCGKPRSLLETNRILLTEHPGPLPKEGDNSVEPPVFVDPTADVEGCTIGPYVSIGPGTKLRNCRLSDCVVGGSLVLENISLSDAIIGNN